MTRNYRSSHVPNRNYGFEKRQKELNRRRKKEEKRQRKLDRAKAESDKAHVQETTLPDPPEQSGPHVEP